MQTAYRMDETLCLETLLKEVHFSNEAVAQIKARAERLVKKVRKARLEHTGLDAFLHAYDLSTEEGITLMCLAEALLRIPDNNTIDRLIKDKLTSGNWEAHLGKSHSWFVNSATWGLLLTGKILDQSELTSNHFLTVLKKLTYRLGEPMIRQAVIQAMKILGRQFVMGETIEAALKRAKAFEERGYRYSYDMLGEAAKTTKDAHRYFKSYQKAIEAIAKHKIGLGPIEGPGISVKLSALHPRYEWVNRERMMQELLPKLKELTLQAKEANIGFTIDAEEADRLELSLLLIEHLIKDPAFKGWDGFGLAVQAYQKRAPFVLDKIIELARKHNQRLMIRLVKGAYWDSEIKWAQEKGLKGYPVFTRKASTDVSYLACVKKLFLANDIIFPQFATHNAYTLSAILEMAGSNRHFEFQCLHGMGDALYDNIVGKANLDIACRVYAPVGGYEELLAYLVRRLLENGANTSFVNQILDEQTSIDELIADPIAKVKHLSVKPHPKIPLPIDLYGNRTNSIGLDLSNPAETTPMLTKVAELIPSILDTPVSVSTPEQITNALQSASMAAFEWDISGVERRADCLERMADLLENHKPELLALLIREAGKTVQDAVSEVREAIDFCRYYSFRARADFAIKVLPGPTGEYNQLSLHGRGVFACISPWNFPLAIFLGQVTAALVAGNTVIAKPASQTPRIALKAVALLHEAGVPKDVVQVLIGSGSQLGNRLIEDERIQGVMFTGYTDTARGINQSLAARKGPIVPFIAETGGQNAMIVDSSALPEQVITDVLASAFNSAGQRCSALRVLFLQSDIAPRVMSMLKGAMAELKIGDPLELSTDVGPVIDNAAKESLVSHVDRLTYDARLIYQCALPKDLPNLPFGAFFAPCAYEIPGIDYLTHEVFGPILHVIQYQSDNLDKVIDSINRTGYGLTLGIHSRINETIDYIRERVHVGNTYVNRNMIGAVVGVQPFGGEGLSGTGPKAGGPHILPRLAIERTLSINTTAAGGNATLMSLAE